MHRCINHVFKYCNAPDNITDNIKAFTFIGLADQPFTKNILMNHCPKDHHICPHIVTQSQLHEYALS